MIYDMSVDYTLGKVLHTRQMFSQIHVGKAGILVVHLRSFDIWWIYTHGVHSFLTLTLIEVNICLGVCE